MLLLVGSKAAGTTDMSSKVHLQHEEMYMGGVTLLLTCCHAICHCLDFKCIFEEQEVFWTLVDISGPQSDQRTYHIPAPLQQTVQLSA